MKAYDWNDAAGQHWRLRTEGGMPSLFSVAEDGKETLAPTHPLSDILRFEMSRMAARLEAQPRNFPHELQSLLAECGYDEVPDQEYELDKGADRARNLLARSERVTEEAKHLREEVEGWVKGWVRMNGPLTDGKLIWKLLPSKDTKCSDPVGAAIAIARDLVLTLPSLDFAAVASVLRSGNEVEEALQEFAGLLAARLTEELAASYLSTNAIKPGAAKKALGKEGWLKFFKVTERIELDSEGNPDPPLVPIDQELMDMLRKRGIIGEAVLVEGEVV